MKKFEYKIIQRHVANSEMNKLGDEGWELVSHSAITFLFGLFGGQEYIFKREKNEQI